MLPYNAMLDMYASEFDLDKDKLDKILRGPSYDSPGFLNTKQKFILDAIATAYIQKLSPTTAIRFTALRNSENSLPNPDLNDTYIEYAVSIYFNTPDNY